MGLHLLAMALIAHSVPTEGDLVRELSTDITAFSVADQNQDGLISPVEFEKYKLARRRPAGSSLRRPDGYSPRDIDGDGAFIPCELYEVADCPDGVYFGADDEDDAAQAGNRYYVDPRSGEVYDGR